MQLEDKFFQKEVRSGYEVSEKMKRVWAVELNILEFFDTLCREHNLRYFVDYGTLLGAVRHQGFIPWDNDIDVVMFRDDYDKLKEIARETVRFPYCFQGDCYTEDITIILSFSRIRDSRTTAIDIPDGPPQYDQGIFIDIFPLDDVPDDITMKPMIGKMQYEMWLSIANPEKLLDLIDDRCSLAFDYRSLIDLIKMPILERIKAFETFNVSQSGKSSKVDFITDYFQGKPSALREWYADTIYLPFENLKVPAPIGYDDLLKCRYGDYMKPVQGASDHEGIIFDPDVPYSQYIKTKK